MQRIAKHLPVLGVILGLAAVAPRVSAQETQTRDSSTAAQDTSDMQNPPGYRGMERDTTGGPDTLTGGAIDTLTLPADTSADTSRGTPRLNPTDTTDTTGTSSGSDTGSAAGRSDSAAVRPGSTGPVTPDEPADRLNPTDSAGTDTSGASQNP
jgi:hypothetical protein